MTTRALKYAVVLAILAAAGSVFYGYRYFNPSPLSIAEQLSGLRIPTSAKLIQTQKEWNDIGDGYSVWVFDVPLSFSNQIASECTSLGYQATEFSEARLDSITEKRFSIFKEESGDECFKVIRKQSELTVILLHIQRLIVYISDY